MKFIYSVNVKIPINLQIKTLPADQDLVRILLKKRIDN